MQTGPRPCGIRSLEQVEDHLDRRHQTESRQVHAFVRPVVPDGDTGVLDLPLHQQFVQGFQPVERLDATGHPSMELEQIDPLDTQSAQRQLHCVPQMPPGIPAAHLGGVVIRIRKYGGLHLGGNVDPVTVPLAQGLADYFFAMTRPVQLSGIDEIDPAVETVVQRPDGRLIIDNSLVPTQLPAAEGYLADLPSGPAERSILHRVDFSQKRDRQSRLPCTY